MFALVILEVKNAFLNKILESIPNLFENTTFFFLNDDLETLKDQNF